jgi:hypothetical protein
MIFGKHAVPNTDGPGYVLLTDEEFESNRELERASERLVSLFASE